VSKDAWDLLSSFIIRRATLHRAAAARTPPAAAQFTNWFDQIQANGRVSHFREARKRSDPQGVSNAKPLENAALQQKSDYFRHGQ